MEQKIDSITLKTSTILTTTDLFNNIAKIKQVDGSGKTTKFNISLAVTSVQEDMIYAYKRNGNNNTHYSKMIIDKDSALLSNHLFDYCECTVANITLRNGTNIKLVLTNKIPFGVSEVDTFLNAYNNSTWLNCFKTISIENSSVEYQKQTTNKKTGKINKAKFKNCITFNDKLEV